MFPRGGSLGQQIARTAWWIPLLWGITAIVLGLLLVTQPGLTAIVVVGYLGAFWLIIGIIDFLGGITHPGPGRGWRIIGGLIGALAGLFVVLHPVFGTVIAVATLYYVLAFGALIHGVMNIAGGNQTRASLGMDGSGHHIVLGIVQVLLGLFLLLHPVTGLVIGTLIWLLGIWAIIGGIASILLAFRLRRLAG